MSSKQSGQRRGVDGAGSGGILRNGKSNKQQSQVRKRTAKRAKDSADSGGASVRFQTEPKENSRRQRSANDDDNDDDADAEYREAIRQRNAKSKEQRKRKQSDEEEYDSDDLMDSVAASSSSISHIQDGTQPPKHKEAEDEWSRTSDQILEAKRRRRETREGEEVGKSGDAEKDVVDDETNFDVNDRPGADDSFKGEESHEGNKFSLLTKLGDEGDMKRGGEAAVEPFNLNTEREDGTGYFDGDTYVFRRSNAADHESDAWLDSLNDTSGTGEDASSTRQPRPSFSTATKRKTTLATENMSLEETCRELASLLASGQETVLQALQRYGALLKREAKRHKQQQTQQQKKKLKQQRDHSRRKSEKSALDEKDGDENDASSELAQDNQEDHDDEMKNMDTTTPSPSSASATPALERARTLLSQVTELAHALLTQHNETQAYEMTRDALCEKAGIMLPNEEASKVIAEALRVTPSKEPVVEPRQTRYFGHASRNVVVATTESVTRGVQWEYRGNQDQEVHGPFATAQVLSWIQAGYFVGASAVDIRMVGASPATTTATTKVEVKDLMADLMDDDDDDDDENDANGSSLERKSAKEDSSTGDGKWMRSDQVDFASYL